jgi:ketosteroid isomerase-like protein
VKKAIIALAASLFTAASALAADRDDIMAVLSQWNDADEAKSLATCADDAAVIDDVPPFEWHGAGACARWQKDYDAYLEKQGETDAAGTIGKPQRLIVAGDRAYAVVPTTFAVTREGKRMTQTATAAFALRRTQAGWRITGWSWATRRVE